MPQGKSVVDASSGGRLNSRTARPGFAGTVPGWTPNATAWKTRSEDGWRNDAGWSGRGSNGRLPTSRVRTALVVRPRHGDVRVRLDHAVRRHGGAVAGASRESSRMGSRTVGTGRERWPMGFGDAHGVRPSVSKLVVQAAAADVGHTRVGLGCRDGRSRVFGRAYRDGCLAGASSMEHPARAYGVLDVPRKRDLVVSVEVGRMVGGRVHWLTLWIVLAVSAFIAYHRILSRRVDDFIRDNG